MPTIDPRFFVNARTVLRVACVGSLLGVVACGSDRDGPESDAPAPERLWAGVSSFLSSEIDDCAELRAWLSEHGVGLISASHNRSFEVRIRCIPSAVRYCMTPLDAFGQNGASASSAIVQGQFTTQYIVELRPRTVSAFDPLGSWRFAEEDIVEVLGGDTVPCAFVQHEPPVPSLPYRRAIIGFDHPESPLDRRIMIRDRDGSHGGDLLLHFDAGVFKAYDMLNVDSTLTRWGA